MSISRFVKFKDATYYLDIRPQFYTDNWCISYLSMESDYPLKIQVSDSKEVMFRVFDLDINHGLSRLQDLLDSFKDDVIPVIKEPN